MQIATHTPSSRPRPPGHQAQLRPLVRVRGPLVEVQRQAALVRAERKRTILTALHDGPQSTGVLAQPLRLSPQLVRDLLKELMAARVVKMVGRHPGIRWALIEWVGPVPAPRVTKPSVRPAAKLTTVSWWVDVPYQAWSLVVDACHVARVNVYEPRPIE